MRTEIISKLIYWKNIFKLELWKLIDFLHSNNELYYDLEFLCELYKVNKEEKLWIDIILNTNTNFFEKYENIFYSKNLIKEALMRYNCLINSGVDIYFYDERVKQERQIKNLTIYLKKVQIIYENKQIIKTSVL